MVRRFLETVLPRTWYRALLSPYHYLWTLVSACRFAFPGKRLVVIGVTGTKGKSSASEMIASILEAAGHRVALASTIRFKTAEASSPNLFKMTVPGHGFLQQFLADAVQKQCTHAVIELTSESVLQHRHRFLYLDALVFTNLQKEHLESHGSMEQYFAAKFELGRALVHSPKRPRAIIANADDSYGRRFLELTVEQRIPFSYADADTVSFTERGSSFSFKGVQVDLPHPGRFSVMNALVALHVAKFLDVPFETSVGALKALTRIPGRAERIECGQSFTAIVDYAHTPDSLSALYDAFPTTRKICVLGNTGGGRDTWKRPEMGRIADTACAEVILTDEDPYDEDPRQIVDAMARGMKRPPAIIMDRREAIRTALSHAKEGDVVLISGKGTDPYIMGPKGTRTPWSDAQVVEEELQKLLS